MLNAADCIASAMSTTALASIITTIAVTSNPGDPCGCPATSPGRWSRRKRRSSSAPPATRRCGGPRAARSSGQSPCGSTVDTPLGRPFLVCALPMRPLRRRTIHLGRHERCEPPPERGVLALVSAEDLEVQAGPGRRRDRRRLVYVRAFRGRPARTLTSIGSTRATASRRERSAAHLVSDLERAALPGRVRPIGGKVGGAR